MRVQLRWDRAEGTRDRTNIRLVPDANVNKQIGKPASKSAAHMTSSTRASCNQAQANDRMPSSGFIHVDLLWPKALIEEV
jgi:hypothetical protein